MKTGYYEDKSFAWSKVKEGDVVHHPVKGWGSVEAFIPSTNGMYCKIRFELPNTLPTFVKVDVRESIPKPFDKIGVFSKQVMFTKDEY